MAVHPRTSNLEVLRRLAQIEEWVSFGYNADQIVDFAIAKWNVTEQWAREYLLRVNERIKEQGKPVSADVLARLTVLQHRLQQKGYEEKNWRIVLDAAKEEAELYGLHDRKETQAPTQAYNIEHIFKDEPQKHDEPSA